MAGKAAKLVAGILAAISTLLPETSEHEPPRASFVTSTLALSCLWMLSGCGGGGSSGGNALALAIAGSVATPPRGTALSPAPEVRGSLVGG